MKQLVLLKEGDYRANVFSDLIECVNDTDTSDLAREKINFFARTDFSYRLHANMTPGADIEGALALTTYLVDPTNSEQDLRSFRPIDVEKMRTALETYSFVLFSSLAENFSVKESDILFKGQYIVRDDEGHLIDLDTKKKLFPFGNDSANAIMKDAVSFFGMVKAKGLPIYYLIIDSNMVHLGDGFDFHDATNDVVFRKITDHDGTIKENVFVPSFSSGTLIGKYDIFTSESSITINFFNDTRGIIKLNNLTELLPDLDITVESNFDYVVEFNGVTLNLDKDVGFVKITFNLGPFFDGVQRKESPCFEYVIHKV